METLKPTRHRARGKSLLHLLLGLLALAAALYMAALAALWWGQERLLFHPTVLAPVHRFRLPPDVQESWIEVPGARLNALHLQLPKPDGVVFFLHGNAGSLETWFVNPEYYRALNLDLYVFDYRGFGKSTGRIKSQAQLQADVRADEALQRVQGTVMLVHGERDTLIPIDHSLRLQALAPRSSLLRVPAAGHGDLQQFPLYLDGLAAALANRASQRPQRPGTIATSGDRAAWQ